MTLPNFFLIGAGRSGTTSIHSYLKQHPEVFMSPIKEPRYFAFTGVQPKFFTPGNTQKKLFRYTTLADYEKLFDEVTDETAIGEASVIYLFSEVAAERIKNLIPNARIIAILRHPVDRAYSRFWIDRQAGVEPLETLEKVFEAEDDRFRDRWPPRYLHIRRGLYYQQLKRYFELFDYRRILILRYEDLVNNESAVLSRIFAFLGVAEDFVPDFTVKLHVTAKSSRPDLSKDVRKRLTDRYFREDIINLKTYVPEGLDHWLAG